MQRSVSQGWGLRAARWLPFACLAALCLAPPAVAQTSGVPAPMSGDCTTTAVGAVTCTRTGGTAFAPSATTDTTNAANIATGVLATSRLPAMSPLKMDTAGMLALYDFTETSGSVLTDQSGNGNDGAVGNAPVRSGASYTFTSGAQSVALPAALNGSNTYYFAITAPPTAGGASPYGSGNPEVVLSTTSNTTSSMNIYLKNVLGGAFAPASALPGTFALSLATGHDAYASSIGTGDIWAGTHVVALSCNSGAPAAFYLDGVPLANVAGALSCYNLQTVGNYLFGAPGNAPGTWPAGMSYWAAAFYSTSDSDALVSKRSLQLKQLALAKGAPFAGQATVPGMFARLIVQGDSNACGWYLPDGKCTTSGAGPSPNAFPFLTTALLNNPYVASDFGVPSAYVQDNIAAGPVLVDPLVQSNFGQSFVGLQSGTNNWNVPNTTAAIWGMQTGWATARAQAGGRPFLIGLPSRGGAGCNGGASCDAAMQATNALQRSRWKNSRFVAYVDLGSDPLLGATGAAVTNAANCSASSTGMFAQDNLHFCVAGHQRLAQAVACVLNGVDGSNANNMDGTAITAASTALGCGDGGRYLDPTNNAVAVTLPSAVWQTGREIAYCNVSSSTANAATLNAPADFPFSNVNGRTTLTVAPNSCVKLRATFNGNTAAPGNYWMQQ